MLMMGALMLLAVAGLVLRGHFMRVDDDELRGPNLHERLEALLAPYEGQQPSPDALRELEVHANTVFRDAITGVGLIPNDWSLVLELDEVLGPVARLHGPGGAVLGTADFERALRDGAVSLPPA